MARRSGSRRTLMLVTSLTALALVLAGCGGDDDSSGAGSEATSEATSEAGSDCVDQAQEGVDQALEPITPVVPTQDLDMAANAGKNVWIILAFSNELLSAIGQGFVDSAEAAGMTATVFDGKGNVNDWNRGVQQAVVQQADGIVLWAIDPALVAESVAAAEAAGIPVAAGAVTDSEDPLPENVSGAVSEDTTRGGQIMADYALAQTGCQGNVLYVTSTLYRVLNVQQAGFEERYEELCPECEVNVIDADLTSVATQLAPQVATELRRDPDISYVVAAIDFFVPLLQTAVREVNPELEIVGKDGAPANLEFVREGTQAADVSFPPNESLGWLVQDVLGRLMLDQPVDQDTFVTQLVDPSNVGETDADIFPQFEGYEDDFLAKWGLS